MQGGSPINSERIDGQPILDIKKSEKIQIKDITISNKKAVTSPNTHSSAIPHSEELNEALKNNEDFLRKMQELVQPGPTLSGRKQ